MKKLLMGSTAIILCVGLMWACSGKEAVVTQPNLPGDKFPPEASSVASFWEGTILQSTDDCSETESGELYTSSEAATLSRPATKYKYCGIRWDESLLRYNVTIDSAFLKIRKDARACAGIGGCGFTMYGVKEGDPDTWSGSQKPSGVSLTTASMEGSIDDICSGNEVSCPPQQSYDVTDIIQEIVQQPTFDSAHAVAMILERTDFCSNCLAHWRTYDFVPSGGSAGDCAAILEVYYQG